MGKKKETNINEYHLNLHQPAKAQFVMHDLRPYIAEHGEQASRAHIHSFYQIIWFKTGKGKHL